MPTPIGKCRFILAGGREPLYGHRPIYGVRECPPTIPKIAFKCNGPMIQVLVVVFGHLQWINESPSDVILN